jgi:lipopolysaccharide cholinephosphotransferase
MAPIKKRIGEVKMLPIKIELPPGFLQEEIRCGFIVSEKMKKVWAVELDLLKELERVCEKHNIKCFASGGTMLGAVRHKGFIPWDDDLDMMMWREDYEKLCLIAGEEFQHPYFFQTEYTDHGSLRGHAQLRNSLTTGILQSEVNKQYTFNQGIFLDIFPLDAVSDNCEDYFQQRDEIMKLKAKYHRAAKWTCRYWNPFGFSLKGICKRLVHMLAQGFLSSYYDCDKYYKAFEEACQKYNKQTTKMVSTLSLQADNKQFFKFRSDYEELIRVPFEFTTILIGKEFDHALRQRYGEYQVFEKGSSLHGNVIFDAEKPYREYWDRKK